MKYDTQIDDNPLAWGSERFTYTLDQLKWIAKMLRLNGHAGWKVLELMSSPTSGFPIEPERVKTFKDGAMWMYMIQKVNSVLMGLSEFIPDWDEELRKAL